MKKMIGAFLLAVALPVASFAAAKNSASVTVYEPIHVGANTLPAGDYTLHWADGTGVVNLTITGNHQNLTVPVTVQAKANQQNSIMTTGEGGQTVLQGFQLKNATISVQDATGTK
jgi:acetamidase/formamidase